MGLAFISSVNNHFVMGTCTRFDLFLLGKLENALRVYFLSLI